MSNEYPYLDGVDVYAYENDFNYNLWGVNTVIRLLNVSWDQTYENVVKFKDNAARDKWTADNTKATYKIDTAINIQPDGEIKLDIPFDVLQKYNYIVVDYPMAPIAGETTDRVGHVGYFINNVMQAAPSTTRAKVFVDYWYTFINDLDITYCDLERGHAPVAAIKAEDFLKNPIEKNQYLLAPDVNYGTAGDKVKQIAEWIANDGAIYAVIATNGNAKSQYWGVNGERSMNVPGIAAPDFFGGATYDYIAIPEERLAEFIILCNTHRPQFIQTIEGIFFVPKKLIWLGDLFTWPDFNDIPMAFLDTSQFRFNLINLKKSDFNFDSRYADLAKLYTFPYSKLEITDEYGNISEVNIENTTGKIDIDAHLNLIYPFLGLDVMMIGIGNTQEVESTFGYRGARNRKFKHGGRWYDLIKSWNIPSFIVSQSRSDQAQFDRFFNNAQATNSLNTAYDNAVDALTIGYGNTEANNLTSRNISNRNTSNAKAISDRSANATYANAEDAANMGIVNADNTGVNINAINNINTVLTRDQLNYARQEQNAARAMALTQSVRGVQLSTTQGIITTGLSAVAAVPASIASIAAGQPGGAALAIGGAAFSGIQTYASMVSNQAYVQATGQDQIDYFNYVNGGLTQAAAGDTFQANLGTLSDDPFADLNLNARKTVNQLSHQNMIASWNRNMQSLNATNNKILTTGGNSKIVEYRDARTTPIIKDGSSFAGTALRTRDVSLITNTDNFNVSNQNTADTYQTAHNNAIASRDLAQRTADRNKALAIAGIDNGNRQQGVQAPAVYGTTSNAGTAATRPIGLFVNVATQSKAAIKAAGDQFLRYGYMLNQAWEPTKLQLMKHFTYWKVNDIWIAGRGNTIEEASETIKNIFLNGTTVWDTPEEVGTISIYDNI